MVFSIRVSSSLRDIVELALPTTTPSGSGLSLETKYKRTKLAMTNKPIEELSMMVLV